MFHLIEPKEQPLYLDLILPFLRTLAANQTANQKTYDPFKDLRKATFLLTKKENKTFTGGALLFKQPIENLPPELEEVFRISYPHMREVWTGTISLQVESNITGHDFETVCKIFYRALYEDLIAFSIKENFFFLCLTLEPFEQLSIDMQGYWSYALEVKPPPSSNALFHGILTLIDGLPENFDVSFFFKPRKRYRMTEIAPPSQEKITMSP